MKYKINYLSLLALFTSLTSFAQGGGHVGGGGEDAAFKAIRDEIAGWMVKSIADHTLETKLKLSGITGAQLNDRYNQAIKRVGEKVLFNDEPIQIGSNVRICKNDRDQNLITCNLAAWREAEDDVRYMIVFHEYLGIAGLETNEGDYSRYPISSKIRSYVQSKELSELKANVDSNDIYYSKGIQCRFRVPPINGSDIQQVMLQADESHARLLVYGKTASSSATWIEYPLNSIPTMDPGVLISRTWKVIAGTWNLPLPQGETLEVSGGIVGISSEEGFFSLKFYNQAGSGVFSPNFNHYDSCEKVNYTDAYFSRSEGLYGHEPIYTLIVSDEERAAFLQKAIEWLHLFK